MASEIVADFVDFEPFILNDAVVDWQQQRMASLNTGHARNLNHSFLSEDQREAVTEVLSQPSGDKCLPAQFWDVPKSDHWLSTTFNIEYTSNFAYHFLLRMAGLSFHQPEKFDRRRADEKATDLRVKEIAPLADENAAVFAADEVRIDPGAVQTRVSLNSGKNRDRVG